MDISSDSSGKLDYTSGDDDNNDFNNDFHSSIPQPNHSKRTHMTAKKTNEIHGSREASAQPSSSLPGDVYLYLFLYFLSFLIFQFLFFFIIGLPSPITKSESVPAASLVLVLLPPMRSIVSSPRVTPLKWDVM